jgi:hypothetical protein
MNRRFAIFQIVFSLVSLAAVVWWATKQEAPEFPSGGEEIAWLVGSAVLYTLATCLRAERWHRILGLIDCGTDRGHSYGLTTVGYMGNNVLPARAGEFLRVMLLDKQHDHGKRTLLGTVLGERILDALALGGIFLVVVLGVLHETALPSGTNTPFIVAGVALALAALGGLVFWQARRRGMMERVHEFFRPMGGAPRALVSRTGVVLLLASLMIWTVEAATYLAVAKSVQLDISISGALYLVAITNLFSMLPAAPGYVGTFDAAVVFGVKALGGTGSQAVSYLILLRFMLFVPITLVGLVVMVTRYGGWARLRSVVRLQTRPDAATGRDAAAEPTI